MAKNISNGVDGLVAQVNGKASTPQNDQLARQWRTLRNKLDSLLMVNNVLKGTELRQRCLALDSMTPEQRETHIQEQWGPLYLQKAVPLLQQISTLERLMGDDAQH